MSQADANSTVQESENAVQAGCYASSHGAARRNVTIRLSDAEAERLKTAAQDRGVSVSACIRGAALDRADTDDLVRRVKETT